MTTKEDKLEKVRNSVAEFKDFPKPGILFRDVFAVLKNPDEFQCLMDLLVEHVETIKDKVDVVVGLDSRGFLFAPLIALHFKIPFVPVRKKGKLPGLTTSVEYSLEYGKDILEIQTNSIEKGQNILVVDDLLATGGSLKASCELIQKLEAVVTECVAVLELSDLKGRQQIPAPVFSLLQF